MTKKVIELVRVSTEGQAADDRASIPAQHAINQRTAHAYGLEIVDCIELVDVSGAAVLRAPGMQRLLKRIEDPAIHGVVTREFSRLMRPERYADYALLEAFQETSTILYLPDGPLDFTNKTGRLLGTIRAAIAGLERSEILERVWSAKEEKRRRGLHPQNQNSLPFGVTYDAKTGKWSYTPEAEKVAEAVRLFLRGQHSYKDVAQQVGIEAFNLRNALRNPIYTGWRVIDKKRDPSPSALRTREDGRQGDRRKMMRKPEEVIRVKVLEPLISEQDFAKLKQILELKKQHHWRVRPDYDRQFIYTGFLRCGECGNLIYTKSCGTGHRQYYICKSSLADAKQKREQQGLADCENPYMRRERLEGVLDDLIAEGLTDRKFLKQIAQAYLRRNEPANGPELARVESGLADLQAKRQRIMDAYFDDLIEKAERDRRLGELERAAALYSSLAARGAAPVAPLTEKELAGVFAVFYRWRSLSLAQKRRLLQAAMPEIRVANYRVSGLSLVPPMPRSDEVNRTDRGSSRRRA